MTRITHEPDRMVNEGLRAWLMETGLRLQATDLTDEHASADVRNALLELLRVEAALVAAEEDCIFPGLMEKAPAEPGESIFARGIGRYILRVGVVFAVIVIGLMLYAARQDAPWATMVFTTLCLAQMGHALSARSDLPLIQVAPFSNPWLLGAVLLTSGLQLLLLYVPGLSRFFGTTPLSGHDLLICVGFSLLFFLYLELEKLWRQWRRRGGAHS